jgi:hypothetical protein
VDTKRCQTNLNLVRFIPLTDWLTKIPWSRDLLEKIAVTQLVKMLPAFYRTRRFISAITATVTAMQLPLLMAALLPYYHCHRYYYCHATIAAIVTAMRLALLMLALLPYYHCHCHYCHATIAATVTAMRLLLSMLPLLSYYYYYCRDSLVGIALGYGLDDRGSRVRFQAGAENFSLHHRVQNGPGAHSASYPRGTRGIFPGGKAAGAWSWPLTTL